MDGWMNGWMDGWLLVNTANFTTGYGFDLLKKTCSFLSILPYQKF
jgi:hypothetical protein